MASHPETTLLALTSSPVEVQVASALQSAAQALGYADGCDIIQLGDQPDLKLFVFEADPWAVMALDADSIDALREAFSLSIDDFAVDVPVNVAGYELVAVPDFADCMGDQDAKRVAWRRMHAAAHPKNPLD